MGSKSGIPIIDLSPFTHGSKDNVVERQQAADELAEKLRESGGFIGITGHGFNKEKLSHGFNIARKLFDLPYDEKMKAPHPKTPTPHRGYSGVGKEQGAAKTALESGKDSVKEDILKVKDYKESYEIGSDENPIHGNIWLPDDVFPQFRELTTKFYWDLSVTAGQIFEALIQSLGLTDQEKEAVRTLYTGHYNQLRLLHYPPVPRNMLEDSDMSRLGAHRDFSFFTLLFQDSNSGLEYQSPYTGEFVPAVPKEGVVYLNIGDMFERLSNGFYLSAMHRVVINSPADGEEATPARYSIPYFVSPVADATVEPQATRVTADGKQKYEPVTPREYAKKMFAVLNLHGEK